MKKAIYPGSFDPITNGHMDILIRASKVFDEVIVLVADNASKSHRFNATQRVEMIEEAIKEFKLSNVKVDSTSGLSVQYAKKVGASHMIRGLRAVSDFEYEFQLAAANEYIDQTIDCVFFMSHNEKAFISSSAVNELYENGVDISKLVPASVLKMYKKK